MLVSRIDRFPEPNSAWRDPDRIRSHMGRTLIMWTEDRTVTVGCAWVAMRTAGWHFSREERCIVWDNPTSLNRFPHPRQSKNQKNENFEDSSSCKLQYSGVPTDWTRVSLSCSKSPFRTDFLLLQPVISTIKQTPTKIVQLRVSSILVTRNELGKFAFLFFWAEFAQIFPFLQLAIFFRHFRLLGKGFVLAGLAIR
jgi:hypothetical protein